MDPAQSTDGSAGSNLAPPADVIIDRLEVQNLILALAFCFLLIGVADWAFLRTVGQKSAGAPATTGFRVDVNSATVEELSLLPHVGPVLAGRIVAERESRGPFLSVADIARTAGIGPDRLSRWESLVATDRSGGR